MHAHATYHGSIPTLRTECTGICRPARGERIGKDHDADTIDPSEVENQGAQKANGEVVHDYVDAEPQGEHLKIAHCGTIMLLIWEHSCDATRL